jgi:solute carrier family 25 (mitochondrial phosphate transporter), member 23/24/25/41
MDGKISFDEFKAFSLFRTNELRNIFNDLDKDGTGMLHLDEIGEALSNLGIKATKKEIKKTLDLFDVNKDGVVSFDEFRQISLMFPSMKVARIFDHATSNFSFGYYSIPKADSSLKGSPLNVFLSGGVAGLVSRTLTAPADRLKVMLQAGEKGATIGGTARAILKEGGVKAFWRGNGVNVLKIMPESAAKFYCYEFLKKKIIQNPDDVQVYERLLSGSLAGMLAQTAIYPMEVVKTRMAISAPGTYTGLANCFSKIIADEGGTALYKGLLASNIGIIPYAGVDLAVYGSIRDWWVKRHPNKSPKWYETLCMGASSSFVGQV